MASRRVFERRQNPTELHGVFRGLLKCGIPTCAEVVVVAGDYAVDIEVDDRGETDYADIYRLRYATPGLQIVSLPGRTPATVKQAIDSAAQILWMDPSAAANRLRVAIDETLTANGVRRTEIVNHKRKRLSTHQRIQEFKKYDHQVGETLEAVKWIGNTGSHETDMTATQVLDGADMLIYALRLLYDTSDDEMQRKVRSINKRRGVPTKRK